MVVAVGVESGSVLRRPTVLAPPPQQQQQLQQRCRPTIAVAHLPRLLGSSSRQHGWGRPQTEVFLRAAAAAALAGLSVRPAKPRRGVEARQRAPSDTLDVGPRSEVEAGEAVGQRPGVATFWTLLYFGPSKGVVALRNVVQQHDEEDRLTVFRLAGKAPEAAADNNSNDTNNNSSDTNNNNNNAATRSSPFLHEPLSVRAGDGFGQFCRLTGDAEKRILNSFKSTSAILGQANSRGVDVKAASDVQPLLELQEGQGSESSSDWPMLSDSDIEGYEEVANYRMPFSFENNFKIHLSPMRTAQELKQHKIPEFKRLSFGLPDSCDVFRSAPFTGGFHSLGIVPAINEQQFVLGNNLEHTWVRFDKGDLKTYDHNLEGLPVLEDGEGIIFPVTHLWVDFDYPTSSYALEWFWGKRCVVRKKFSLWPMPNFLFNKIINLTLSNLQNIPVMITKSAASAENAVPSAVIQ